MGTGQVGSYRWRTSRYGQSNGNVFYTAGGEIVKENDKVTITLDLDKIPDNFKVDAQDGKLILTWDNEWGKPRIKRIKLPCNVEDHKVTKVEFNGRLVYIEIVRAKKPVIVTKSPKVKDEKKQEGK